MTRTMTQAVLRSGTMALLLTVVTIWYLAPIGPLPQAQLINRLVLCQSADCPPKARRMVELPLHISRQADLGSDTLHFALPPDMLPDVPTPDPAQVYYFPAAPRHITLNGQSDLFSSGQGNPYERPVILPAQGAPSVLTLRWLVQEGTVLQPFYLAPQSAIRADYLQRLLTGQGLAIVGLVLMLASLALCGSIVWKDRSETMFLWLALSNIPGGFISLSYLLPFDITAPAYSLGLLVLAAHLFVMCLFFFMNRLVKVDFPILERIMMCGAAANLACLIALPAQHMVQVSTLFGIWSMCWAIGILTVFQLNNEAMSRPSFLCLFGLLTLALAMAYHDWIRFFTQAPIGAGMSGQALPATIGSATLWLVARRLLNTMDNLRDLNRSLDLTVARKSRELAESRTKDALNAERNRITVELHDGIGGSLMNILAYAEESSQRDPVLEEALEDVLREIGVIMDNMATLDAPLDVTLGGLRHRYEALFDRLGVKILWEVQPSPHLPDLPPEQKLNFVRVIQETLNNVAKHAQASCIRVHTNPQQVCIEDDGIGLTAGKLRKTRGFSNGFGLPNIARRAQEMGADLSVDDTGKGTRVCLHWPHPIPIMEI
jgi:signal transduction histidine kinase